MPDNSATLHESPEVLGPDVIDQHRAIASLMEELEAVDWYHQRVQAASDDGLRAILAHNRDEEKEHAMMVLEWLRRRDAVLDGHMRTYLFTDAPITEIETIAEHGGDEAGEVGAGAGDGGDLGIGDLRGEPVR
jgi:ferritin-like protein